MSIEHLITDHLATWTNTIQYKKATGRGSNKKIELYGIKRLRELILELAVRGRLVPQDANDEPASVLLEKIKAERERLVKEKKIKKPKALPEITDEEKPFELPDGWEWVRLGDIGETNIGLTYSPKDKNTTGTPVLRSSNIQKNKIDLNDLVRVNKKIKPNVFLQAGDLLICARNGSKALVGKTAMIKNLPEKMAFGAFMAIFRCTCNPYIEIFLNSSVFRRKLEGVTTTTINQITQSNLKQTITPLPPEAEQPRIVAKVDELMALCDQLEQQTEQSLATHETLVSSLLTTLTQSQSAEDLATNWEILSQYFHVLFTTESSIDQLKQTILQLAVMGKLVPQDPNDEPASVLLAKIKVEKEQLIKEKKIKKQKPLPTITDEEKPFELPEGWEWCRFADLVHEVATGPFGSMIHKHDYINNGIPLINPSHMIELSILEDKSITVSKEKAKELASYQLSIGDIVMARRGEMGRCALVTSREEGWLCGTGSFILKFHKDIYRPFVLNLFRTSWVKTYLGGNSVGTTMVNLNHKILNNMPILLPPTQEAKRINQRTIYLLSICDQLKTKLNQAQQTQLQLTDTLVNQAL